MTTNIREFVADLEQFIGEQLPEAALLAHKKITLDFLSGVVKKSPVDTGRFRANWQVSAHAPLRTAVSKLDPKPRGTGPDALALNQAGAALRQLKPYGVSYVQNNLPYAQRLETGWSRQAPAGMVALTLAELRNTVLDEEDIR